jgi:hypothetical protein
LLELEEVVERWVSPVRFGLGAVAGATAGVVRVGDSFDFPEGDAEFVGEGSGFWLFGLADEEFEGLAVLYSQLVDDLAEALQVERWFSAVNHGFLSAEVGLDDA